MSILSLQCLKSSVTKDHFTLAQNSLDFRSDEVVVLGKHHTGDSATKLIK
jgi:hypothetical protein